MKKHKVLSLLVSAAMAYSAFPAIPVAAKGTPSQGLSPADSIKANVDKTKFTHKEWTGTHYTDVDGNPLHGCGRQRAGCRRCNRH
ncbi:hypothetical protein [Allobaculum sp. Allo2]|uniref:hypothetical protein n=1 Tax=Allobaculum sp. Allo2 TaxID=2853432 RepID=UPI001F604608|nr:hypothetical protein [Allobaculum sp. Allo2]UNT93299.1 hypothetical protein KWG61_00005 [Allobaculum sp. Allo2]